MISAYPLQWPPGWPRTKVPQWSSFKVSQHEAQNGIVRELHLLGARNVVISTDVELRQDGMPRSGRRAPEDQGVAVYFDLHGNQQCIPCDKWRTLRENMRAIELTIAALRGLDRWGAKEMVDAAFRGFTAIPANASSGQAIIIERPWYEVLGVSPDAPREVVEAAYKAMRRKTHPDAGGSESAFNEVQRAYEDSQR